MRLRLELCDIDTQLKIKGWHITRKNEDIYDNWCCVEISLVSRQINIHHDGSILMSDEVSEICDAPEELLNGKTDTEFSVDFIEPDLNFKFYPAEKIENTFGELKINLWGKGVLSGNSLTVTLYKNDLFDLRTYLKYVTKRISKDDPTITELINKGVFLPEYAFEYNINSI